jgi:hypothetical protein
MTHDSAAVRAAAASSALAALAAIEAIQADEAAERCVLRPSGAWFVQRRGQLQRQSEPLPAAQLAALIEALRALPHPALARGWRITWLDGAGGGLVSLERAAPAKAHTWDGEAAGLLLQAMRRGVRAAILGAPWSMHDDLLAWAASRHHAAHIFYVADVLPAALDAERVLHLYPPADPDAQRQLTQLLDGAPAVFWARVDSLDALRSALGAHGAQSRWFTIHALDQAAALDALLNRCEREQLPAPTMIVHVEANAGGAPAIQRIQLMEDGLWQDIYDAATHSEPISEPLPEPQPTPATSAAQMSALRTSAEIALRELGLSPGEGAYQPAASTINELFEDSDSEASALRESGELTAQAALEAQQTTQQTTQQAPPQALQPDEQDLDETSELTPLRFPEPSPHAETPLFGFRQVARAATPPVELKPAPQPSAPAPTTEPEKPSAKMAEILAEISAAEDDSPATTELNDLLLEDSDPPEDGPGLPAGPDASRMRETLDEAPPILRARPTIEADAPIDLARVSSEDFVLEEYLHQRATREANVGELMEIEDLKAASLPDAHELEDLDDAVTGNVPGALLHALRQKLDMSSRQEAPASSAERTSAEQGALDVIGELDDLYDLGLPPARLDSLGTEPSLRAFQSIPQSDVLAVTSPNLHAPSELSWSEEEDTQHRVLQDEGLTTLPHKRTLSAAQAPSEPTDESSSRRSALSQRLRALSQQRQGKGEADEAPSGAQTNAQSSTPHADQTRQQTVNKGELLWRLRQQLHDEDH